MRSIVLFGMMGTGKTTVGAIVARRLSRRLVDTDAEIERRAGRPVGDLIADEGEERFRALERDVVADGAVRGDLVLSVGGGAVLDDANVAALRRCGVLIELHAPAEVIVGRLGPEPAATRPLLRAPDPVARVAALQSERAPRYEQVADHRIDASGSPEEVATAVLRWVAGVAGVLTDGELAGVRA